MYINMFACKPTANKYRYTEVICYNNSLKKNSLHKESFVSIVLA